MAIWKSCKLLTALVALTLLPAWGCAPGITVESIPGPGHEMGLQRVFIVLDSSEIDEKSRLIRVPGAEFGNTEADTLTFGTEFLEKLGTALGKAGVRHRTYVSGEAKTDRAEVVRQAEDFQAQAILWILGMRTGIQMVDSGTQPSYTRMEDTYGLEAMLLTIPITRQNLWSGTIKLDAPVESWRGFAPNMADKLVDKLVADRVIGSMRVE